MPQKPWPEQQWKGSLEPGNEALKKAHLEAEDDEEAEEDGESVFDEPAPEMLRQMEFTKLPFMVDGWLCWLCASPCGKQTRRGRPPQGTGEEGGDDGGDDPSMVKMVCGKLVGNRWVV